MSIKLLKPCKHYVFLQKTTYTEIVKPYECENGHISFIDN